MNHEKIKDFRKIKQLQFTGITAVSLQTGAPAASGDDRYVLRLFRKHFTVFQQCTDRAYIKIDLSLDTSALVCHACRASLPVSKALVARGKQ